MTPTQIVEASDGFLWLQVTMQDSTGCMLDLDPRRLSFRAKTISAMLAELLSCFWHTSKDVQLVRGSKLLI